MKVENILEHKGTGVITIDHGQTIQATAEMMMHHGIAALVVIQNGMPIGLVSDRDVVEALATHNEHGGHRLLRLLATRRLIAVPPEETIKRAMSLMTYGRVRHLPVIEGDELIGIVSLDDIVKYRLEEPEMGSNVLRDISIAAR